MKHEADKLQCFKNSLILYVSMNVSQSYIRNTFSFTYFNQVYDLKHNLYSMHSVFFLVKYL